MGSATRLVHRSTTDRLLGLSFEQQVESLLLVVDSMMTKTSDMDLSFSVVLDADSGARRAPGLIRQQVPDLLVVDL